MTALKSAFHVRTAAAYAVITFSGFVDAASVEEAKPALQRLVPVTCANIVIDLAGVEFLDSHGVGLFVSLLKRAHMNKGKLYFAGAGGQPASVLNMVGFSGNSIIYCKTASEAESLLETPTEM
jgi:anti-sigma B factor antagonist